MNTNAYVYINTFLPVYILLTNCLLTKYVYIINVYIIILTNDNYNNYSEANTNSTNSIISDNNSIIISDNIKNEYKWSNGITKIALWE